MIVLLEYSLVAKMLVLSQKNDGMEDKGEMRQIAVFPVPNFSSFENRRSKTTNS